MKHCLQICFLENCGMFFVFKNYAFCHAYVSVYRLHILHCSYLVLVPCDRLGHKSAELASILTLQNSRFLREIFLCTFMYRLSV